MALYSESRFFFSLYSMQNTLSLWFLVSFDISLFSFPQENPPCHPFPLLFLIDMSFKAGIRPPSQAAIQAIRKTFAGLPVKTKRFA